MSLQYKLLSLLFLLTSSTLLFSQDKVLLQPPLLIDSVKSYQLNDFYYLLEDEQEQLTIEEVASSTYEQKFVPIKNLSPLKVGMVYWGRIVIQNNLDLSKAKTNWLFKPKDGVVTEMQVYYKEGTTNQFQKKVVGEYVPNSINDGLYQFAGISNHTIPLSLPLQKPLVLFVRMKNEFANRAPSFEGQLTFPKIKEQNTLIRLNFISGLFLGAICIMCIYIGVLAYYLKDKTYLYYALYLLFMVIVIGESFSYFSNWIFTSVLVNTSPKYRFIYLILRTPLVIFYICLLYTSPSPRDATLSRMPSSA